MEAGGARREKPPPAPAPAPPPRARDPPGGPRDKAKQRAAQHELKQRQRAEIYALNRVMTELEQQQFDAFCKQMQASGE
uniref:small vasohibin-binding protein n=1 Tax=Euleptes europaea TaxID=460621 RepID=UPI00253FA50E|nr:small vasohibin-binding protein [Euleptes europaea]